jgi:hypothetical protein
MSILFEMSLNLQRLRGMDSYGVKNAFFANYLAGLIMLKLKDLKGLVLIKDPQHARLTRFDNGMSDPNFWGRALFFPDDPLVKKNLQHGHAQMLSIDSGRILHARIEKTMRVLQQDPNTVNWQETCAGLVLLRHRYELKSSLFDKITKSLINWASLSEGAQRKAIGDSFLYLMQADPKSSLLAHMRNLANNSMINDITASAMKMVNFNRLREDDAGGADVTSTANIGSTSNAILNTNVDIANTMTFTMQNPIQVGATDKDLSKRIKKRKPKFKLIKFKAPAHFKQRNSNE